MFRHGKKLKSKLGKKKFGNGNEGMGMKSLDDGKFRLVWEEKK